MIPNNGHVFLDLARISDRGPGDIGCAIYHFSSVPSTNKLLRNALSRGAPHGTVFIADEQSAGRGRRDRAWKASPGSGLLSSALLSPVDSRYCYALAALAVRDAIADITSHAPALKWPNDVLVDGKKVCGILSEQVNVSAIVGIGINTNMNKAEIARIGPDATSLSLTAGREIDHSLLLEALLRRLQEQYVKTRQSPESVFQDWRDSLVTLGRIVEVQAPDTKWTGLAVDVAEDGALLVTNDRRLVRVYAADVRIRAG
jgi:BirA family biotin operon repressor/biotin-[acetyl-CoA-carboxylase] ligase